MRAVAPMSRARFASATLMMPLRQNCLPHFFRTLSASFQFIDWSSIVLKIIADGYRDIRTLLHIIFQLGQRKLLVREVVDRPSRVHGEAEETLKSQARW